MIWKAWTDRTFLSLFHNPTIVALAVEADPPPIMYIRFIAVLVFYRVVCKLSRNWFSFTLSLTIQNLFWKTFKIRTYVWFISFNYFIYTLPFSQLPGSRHYSFCLLYQRNRSLTAKLKTFSFIIFLSKYSL